MINEFKYYEKCVLITPYDRWLSGATDEMSCTAAGVPHLRHCYSTLHVLLDYCNTYTYYVTNGGIYLYIRTRVCECSPIIINICIRTNPKTMTFSACGRGSSTSATLSFALLPYLTIHGGR